VSWGAVRSEENVISFNAVSTLHPGKEENLQNIQTEYLRDEFMRTSSL
jgi:hypothetical protein